MTTEPMTTRAGTALQTRSSVPRLTAVRIGGRRDESRIDEVPVLLTSKRTAAALGKPERTLVLFTPSRYWKSLVFDCVIFLSGIVGFIYLLRSELGDLPLPRQEFEGLAVVLCVLSYVGIFLRRVSRALAEDARRVEAHRNLLEIPSTVVAGKKTGE